MDSRHQTAEQPTNLPFHLAVLAQIARIGHAENERFGDRKVFISAVFRAMAKAGHDVGSLDAFKARLIVANRDGLLQLARADLVGAMPAAAVSASEIRSLGAEFHFVIDPDARDAWSTSATVGAA